MIRHASSHGLAVLITVVASALLIEICKSLLPTLYARLEAPIATVAGWLGLTVAPDLLVTLVIAVGLGLIWGIGFYLAYKR